MNTCVDFQIIGRTVRPIEEMTIEDFDAGSEYGLTLLRSIAQSLTERGVKVGKVGPGKGCAASFLCDIGPVCISCSLSVKFPERQSAFHCSIGNWVAPSLWKQIFHLAPNQQQEDEALQSFCQMLDDILLHDSRLENLRWWTLQEWCEGKHTF